MVQLAALFIDALCRHLPEHEIAIRQAVAHLLEDPERMADPRCCQRYGEQPFCRTA